MISAAAAAAVVLVGGGAALAGSDDDATEQPIEGAALERAEAAALQETGGGRVTATEVEDEDSQYEVEVTLDDGSQVDVQLDQNFRVVSSDGDHEDDTSDDEATETDESTEDDDATERPIEGSALKQAEAAALQETGGGEVTGTEVGDEDSYYEVEVTLDDGSQVDVQLDRDFRVVSTDADEGDAGED